ncbi:hypothetical protein CJU90_3912 [Yarrowia sp. C11]|nr:hypothetical protein CKK34_5524 [Yarrowia sp. E02]KAG5367611.1 hypothetical protein CJU90_3912 [Yarrowia sp. C11]
MLRARVLLRPGRQTRFLHAANTLRKKGEFEDTLFGEFEAPSKKEDGAFQDPFAAFKDVQKDAKDDPLAFDRFALADDGLDSANFGFRHPSSGFEKTNRFKFDAMDDPEGAFDAREADDLNGTKFDWSEGLGQWGEPGGFSETENRYYMPQDVDMSPLRGNSEEVSTHVIQRPETSGSDPSAAFEKIFAKVMGGGGQQSTQTTRDKSHEKPRVQERDVESDVDSLRQASGVELPSNNSPYVYLFNSSVPELFVEICAEPDMEVRHEQIVSLDLSECNETETAIMGQLQELIGLNSDYDVLEFMSTQLDEFEKLDKKLKTPAELPPMAAGFPLLLNEALQLLVEKFESPAEAVSLFDEVKARSGNLFFATGSTDVYFTMIRIVWEFYRDLSTLSVLASDIALMNIKSRAVVKAMEDIERDCYKMIESRKRRVPEYSETISARQHNESLRRFSVIINFLRRSLKLKDSRQRAFRLRGELCTY